MKKIIILFIAAVALVSCERIRPSGNIISMERSVEGFSRIAVSHGMNTTVTMGTEESLEVTADDNLLPYIETYVSGGTLYIQIQNHVSFRGSPHIRIAVGAVELTALSGSGGAYLELTPVVETADFDLELSGGSRFEGNITASDDVDVNISGGGNASGEISAARMDIDLSGGSRADLSGFASSMKLDCSGGGSLGNYSLAADNVTANLSGGSHVQMTVNVSLTVSASGGSEFLYKGNPAVDCNDCPVRKAD